MEDYTGIRRINLLILAATAAMAFILFGFGSNALCEWIGFLYPMYASFKCLETHPLDPTEISNWLIYWIVFGVFQTSEFVADSFLSRFPFYYPLKVVFVLWCLLPRYRGAVFVYTTWIEHLLSSMQPRIDLAKSDIINVVNGSIDSICTKLRSSSRSIFTTYSTTFHFVNDKQSNDI